MNSKTLTRKSVSSSQPPVQVLAFDVFGTVVDWHGSIAREMRDASTAHQAQRPAALWADVDPAAALQLLDAAGCDTLVHGHTHRPGRVQLSATASRHVLSDWDFDGDAPRGDVLRLSAQGLQAQPALALAATGRA